MVKHFQLNQDVTINGEKYPIWSEFNIKDVNGTEYLIDGCFSLCSLKFAQENNIGQVAERLY